MSASASGSTDGAVHAALVTDELLVSDDAANSPARTALRSLASDWRRLGAPRTHQLRASATRDRDAWTVRLDA